MTQSKIEAIIKQRKKELANRFIQEQVSKFNEGYAKEGVTHFLVCGGPSCAASHGEEIKAELDSKIAELGLSAKAEVALTGCFGLCAKGPFILVLPQGILYSQIKLRDLKEIASSHLEKGEIVKRLVYPELLEESGVKPYTTAKFFAKQKKIALENVGKIDPARIDDYLAYDGYQALAKVVHEMTPEAVVKVLLDSKLRGRGGAGFSTGLKWEFTRRPVSAKKYVVCNADEGDPGAFMDRCILEGDPHSVIEAMTIAAKVIGADEGYIYIRAEYPAAVNRLKEAIAQAESYGFLGEHILGTDFNFHLHIRLGAGAFVCGEETALIESIEGKRGVPRNKPPFPAAKGLWGKPTLINNVETYANIPKIIRRGADWFLNIGTSKSGGTKVFSLGGNIENTGLIEVPLGTPLSDVVFEIGGGIPQGGTLKAIQTGGPSGGCIPARLLDAEIEYESLRDLGSMMGSGGLIVMDDGDCMVDIAKFYLKFSVDESCGKCTPCRIGNKRLYEMLDKITKGQATLADLRKIEELAHAIRDTSACGLGQSSPNPVISTLEYFRNEYLAHIKEQKCPSGVCKDLFSYQITDKCVGCTKCRRMCPTAAITGELKHLHEINQAACIKCGVCMAGCPVHAIIRG